MPVIPLHIGYLTHYFPPEPGAPAGRAADLSALWAAAGHRVSVLTTLPNHPRDQVYPEYRSHRALTEFTDGMTVERLWLYASARRTPLATALCHASFALHAAVTARWRRGPRPNVWIASSPPLFTGWAGAHIGAHHRVPVILEVRDLWPDYFEQMGVLRNRLALRWLHRLERRLYARAAAVVTVAEGSRTWLIERKGVPPAKVHCIPNGIDPDRFAPSPDRAATVRRRLSADGRFLVAYIGNHGLGQGLETVVDAAQLLAADPQIHFLFVGEGAEKARVAARAERLGLANVTFLPACSRDEVPAYYQAADLCLVPLADIPAFRNTIPSKVFEILGSARPVIGALRGEGAQVIARSGAGVVVPPADPTALAAAVRRMQTLTPAERHEMGERGRCFVTEHYDRRRLAQRYLGVIRAVVQSPRSPSPARSETQPRDPGDSAQ
ncbi:MAG TPA: glycosyltransferase family 4 protein [Gemmatimonadales bacterium]|nr:glycosyltransferase family 4 protein [Gemmatimonadales bacterium]